jgi:hypothetical protein
MIDSLPFKGKVREGMGLRRRGAEFLLETLKNLRDKFSDLNM